mmetsp:Transcript_65284/g.156023  ORF Transcript_65284/g.156023 Transcript_65284/m.156023 type:complete len:392 (+) Transcript_65284:81-1256(+)
MSREDGHVGYEVITSSRTPLDTGFLPEEDLHTQAKIRHRVLLGVGVVVWMVIGTVLFIHEGYTLGTSLYGMMQIITTVGYGDILPTTERGKLLITALVLTSTIVISGALSEIADMILDYQTHMVTEAMTKKSKALAEHAASRTDSDSLGRPPSKEALDVPSQDSSSDLHRRLVINGLVFATFIVIGMLYFWHFESCSCSYGRTKIEGCEPDKCTSTGGMRKTLLDSLYMSVITLSTVGFGDESALSRSGRWFAIFWMLFGVGAMVNFVGEVSSLMNDAGKTFERALLTENLFRKMDRNGDGSLDEIEFFKFQLQSNGIATEQQLQEIEKQFRVLDKNGDHRITMAEIQLHYHGQVQASTFSPGAMTGTLSSRVGRFAASPGSRPPRTSSAP